jgi:hypothetical protein
MERVMEIFLHAYAQRDMRTTEFVSLTKHITLRKGNRA